MPSPFESFLACRDPAQSVDDAVKAAWNAALAAAAKECDAQAQAVGLANPGRGKGTVSSVGVIGQVVADKCAARVKALVVG